MARQARLLASEKRGGPRTPQRVHVFDSKITEQQISPAQRSARCLSTTTTTTKEKKVRPVLASSWPNAGSNGREITAKQTPRRTSLPPRTTCPPTIISTTHILPILADTILCRRQRHIHRRISAYLPPFHSSAIAASSWAYLGNPRRRATFATQVDRYVVCHLLHIVDPSDIDLGTRLRTSASSNDDGGRRSSSRLRDRPRFALAHPLQTVHPIASRSVHVDSDAFADTHSISCHEHAHCADSEAVVLVLSS